MTARVQTMFYAGKEKPWHGLGVQVDKELTAAEAIKAAGLDWKVDKKPIFYYVPKDRGFKLEAVPNKFVTVRADNNQALGVVGDVYMPLQNSEAFSFADGIIQEKAAVYHTAGALGNGGRIWVLAKLSDVCIIKGDDIVEKFLLLSNSHDGTSGIRICLTPIRVVCQNTLNQAITSASNLFKIRHTSSMGGRVTEAREALGLCNKFFAEFEEKARALAGKQLNGQVFNAYLESLGFDPDAEATRSKSQFRLLTHLFEDGKGQRLDGARGTAWGAYNAVAEYLTHERSTRVTESFKSEREARLNSLWFGNSQIVNQKAWDNALALLK